MASDSGRGRQNAKAGNNVGGRVSRRGKNHAQSSASEAGAVDGCVYSRRADVHYYRTDGEWVTAGIPA